jgi:hypothetical protein
MKIFAWLPCGFFMFYKTIALTDIYTFEDLLSYTIYGPRTILSGVGVAPALQDIGIRHAATIVCRKLIFGIV